jgi:threonine dehydratase
MNNFPDKDAILETARRIEPYASRTPVFTSQNLNQLTGANLFFKCENLQKTGSFKFRGACNSVFSLTEQEAKNGVATHSSGNHAQALALAASLRGIPAYIVMPKNAAKPKVEAVQQYGGIITFCKPNLKSREEILKLVILRTKATEIHPYNYYKTICGQATAAKELIEDAGQALDIIMAPVGGGGLISGTALSAHYFADATRVIAAEPENANDAFLSFKAGHIIPAPQKPNTIADGLLTSLGNLTFPIISKHVHDIVTVGEEDIVEAMKLIWERLKACCGTFSGCCFCRYLKTKSECKRQKCGCDP